MRLCGFLSVCIQLHTSLFFRGIFIIIIQENMRWLVEESINQHIQEEETISLKTSQQILTNVVCMFQGQLL